MLPQVEWFIATAIYFHNRRTSTPNIGANVEKNSAARNCRHAAYRGAEREHAELGWPRPGRCSRFWAMASDSPPAAVPAPDLPPQISQTSPACSSCSWRLPKCLAGFGGVLVWARRGIVDQHRWMTAEVQRDLRAVPFPAGAEYRQSVRRVRLAVSRTRRRDCGLRRADPAADGDRDNPWPRSNARAMADRRAAAGSAGVPRGGRAFDVGRLQNDDAADPGATRSGSHSGRGVHCNPAGAAAFARVSTAGSDPVSLGITYFMRRRVNA